jgi:hypothetical protein
MRAKVEICSASDESAKKPPSKEELMKGFENFDYYPRNREKNLFAWKTPRVDLAEVLTEVHVSLFITVDS